MFGVKGSYFVAYICFTYLYVMFTSKHENEHENVFNELE